MAAPSNVHTSLTPADELAQKRKPPFAGESEAYSQARKKLLAEEIEFRRHMTRLSEQRRALPPGPVIRTNYRFKLANGSEVGLRDQHLDFVQTVGDAYAKDLGLLDDQGNELAAIIVYQRQGDEVRLF